MDNKVIWLRVAYWSAAIADFIVAILVLIPSRMGVNHYVYPMGLMAAVAFSWGVFLILADRSPLERRWSLVPTILVVTLIAIVALHAGLTGLIPLTRIIPTIIVTSFVLIILIYAYIITRDLD